MTFSPLELWSVPYDYLVYPLESCFRRTNTPNISCRMGIRHLFDTSPILQNALWHAKICVVSVSSCPYRVVLQKCIALSRQSSLRQRKLVRSYCGWRRLCRKWGLSKSNMFCFAIAILQSINNSTFHSRSKHIPTRYNWIRDVLEAKDTVLEKVYTEDHGADMLMKVLPRGKFELT